MLIGDSPEGVEVSARDGRPANPEVLAKAKRRRFSIEYKLKVLEEADRCRAPGQIGALLRREGLYFSNLTYWRRQRREGGLGGLRPKRRGRKAGAFHPLSKDLARLEGEKRDLERRLVKAEAIIEFQKKVHALLGIPLRSPQSEDLD